MSKVIGIDLGTTNSCVAVVEGGKPVVITNAEGERTTPSVVAFTKDGERLVGGAAKRQIATNSGRTVSSIKRYMGSDHRVHIDGRDLTPQEISAMILTKIRRDAESYLGEPVTEAVITAPAYFDDSQRKATQDAGRIAGLNVLRIINEPTAAAVAYGLDNEAPQKILVYDLGGGTFDVSIIEIEDGTFTVLATGGDTHLGGDDFDERIVEWAVAEFRRSDRIDLTKDPAAMGRLKEEAEKAKKELSSALSAQLNLPFIAVGKDGPHHLDLSLGRPQFEMMTGDLLARTVQPVQNALRDAGISASQLGKVLLVGGSTRMPAVERQVRELLGCEPSHTLNPDECVAMGAAVQGGLLQGGGKLAGAKVFGRHLHHAVHVDIEGNFDLRFGGEACPNAGELEFAQTLVVAGKVALALQHVDLHTGLHGAGRGKDLALAGVDPALVILAGIPDGKHILTLFPKLKIDRKSTRLNTSHHT